MEGIADLSRSAVLRRWRTPDEGFFPESRSPYRRRKEECRCSCRDSETDFIFWRWTLGLNLDDKKAVVAEVSAQVAKAQAIIVAEYRGLEVGNMTDLRREARKSGVYLRVLKNTLARR